MQKAASQLAQMNTGVFKDPTQKAQYFSSLQKSGSGTESNELLQSTDCKSPCSQLSFILLISLPGQYIHTQK